MVKPCHNALSGTDLILNYDSKDNTAPTRDDPLKYFPVPAEIFSAESECSIIITTISCHRAFHINITTRHFAFPKKVTQMKTLSRIENCCVAQ